MSVSFLIETSHLTKRFDGVTAVEDLSLHVKRGEVLALLGPNGAGKTTTIRLLLGLLAPTEGTVHVLGYDMRRRSQAEQARARVGVLTETPGLYETLSALENLRFFAALYNVRNAESAIETYLRLVELWDRRHERVGTFSKGMRQRLALARALLHEPDILFLDEPTSGLDPAATRRIRELLLDLKTQGRTILLTTHNLDEAERLADRIAVLRTRLLVIDTPEALRLRLYGRRVRIECSAPCPQALEIVQALPFVRHVAASSENTLLVQVESPEEQNPALIEALVQAGAKIRWVEEDRVSLEDVYLQLVGDTEEEAV
ncbi:ABC-2 type transport system ATP-binding protein [Ardenticatena maritima]|uniref:ABC transporter ATPase n=1 Tax=Ardenticatena maritima TaxID=872965 RepID=A0A0M8K4Q3_9CHLR|nr:ABC transporter ATP-binding protein [Ardenticatena maritima]KPL87976.1 ABC transporter ATPase [Ardenticatena maritima]GAP61603.1 ABC-2 type transport system ATP-binding protein [Ardenticatena maritima]